MSWLIVGLLGCLVLALGAAGWTALERRRRRSTEATTRRLVDAVTSAPATPEAIPAPSSPGSTHPTSPSPVAPKAAPPVETAAAVAPDARNAPGSPVAPDNPPSPSPGDASSAVSPYPGFSSLGSMPLAEAPREPMPGTERLIPQLEFEADISGWSRGERQEGVASFVMLPGAAQPALVFQCAPLGGHPEKTASDWLALALTSMVRPPAHATELPPQVRGGCDVSAAHVEGGELPILVLVARGREAALLMTLVPCAEPRPPAAFEKLLETFRSTAAPAPLHGHPPGLALH